MVRKQKGRRAKVSPLPKHRKIFAKSRENPCLSFVSQSSHIKYLSPLPEGVSLHRTNAHSSEAYVIGLRDRFSLQTKPKPRSPPPSSKKGGKKAPTAPCGIGYAVGRQAGRQGRTDTGSRVPPPSPSGPALSHARLSFLLLLLHFHRGHQSVAPCSIACCCCCCCPTQRSRKGTAEGKEKELPKKVEDEGKRP